MAKSDFSDEDIVGLTETLLEVQPDTYRHIYDINEEFSSFEVSRTKVAYPWLGIN